MSRRERAMKVWRGTLGGIAGVAILGAFGVVMVRGNAGDQRSAAVDEVFEDLTKAGSPGCALGVYRDGLMLYEKGYGLANIEENVPITPRSVFDIGSTSKQFSA